MTKRALRTASWVSIALLLALVPVTALAQKGEGPLRTDQPQGITVPEIIQRFAEKEKQFKEAREHYTWQQDVRVQSFDGDRVDGEYHQISNILFDDRGRRIEQVVFAPQDTLQHFSMSPEDFEDIQKRLPFVLTSDEISEYDINYVGQQKEDELDTYVFDVKPKKIEKGKRYFEGRIWVDNTDFQIVKTYGKNVPDIKSKNNENLFPNFTTWRELIDGKYWFPTYTKIDDFLHFSTGDQRIRQIVKYTDYKRFGSNVKITYEGQDVEKKDNKDNKDNKKDNKQPPPKQ